MDASSVVGPGVIVVAEPALHRLLSTSGVQWNVQPRQPGVSAMWDSLSGGHLDSRSRVLVFSDSQAADSPADGAERAQVARAVVAMANAGAHVFVAEWRPELWGELERDIQEAAQSQGVAPGSLVFHRLAPDRGGRAVLETMRPVLADIALFPDQLSEELDDILIPFTGRRTEPVPGGSLPTSDVVAVDPAEEPPTWTPPTVATGALSPSLPPIGGATIGPLDSDYPPSASLELLSRPKRPGQVTITVTSSKGGSGKSTASILLAGTIARASAQAGRPLSVCLIDLDTRDGQVASLIGTFMPTALNIRVQPVWDEERIRRNLVRASGLGIDTLLAPIRPRTADTVGPDFYRAIVRSLQRMYDVVIMDTSVQYLGPLIADVALVESDEILFVTTLASTAIQGMARALREMTAPVDESGLGIPREKIGIIVNQSLANVGMEREQVLAAGLGVPVVGAIPLATKDVLTATNLNCMHDLLDHPVIGPAYVDLARACLPGHELAPWSGTSTATDEASNSDSVSEATESKRRGLFRR